MNVYEIRKKLASDAYGFLRTNPYLGNSIILLTLGGSYAYGTNIENSDLDVRGCALNSKTEILTNLQFGQYRNNETDTTIYSFNKLVSLLVNTNPNTIEMLGCRPQHYFYVSPIGQELLDNAHMFLSKRAVNSFGGYANQQLRRLSNLAVRVVGQSENEQHILKTIEHASYDFFQKYFAYPSDAIRLYIDNAVKDDMETEIFMNVKYREKEHDLLMDIRNGKFLDENDQPTLEFFDLVNDLEKRLDYAKNNTSPPDNPDYKRINEFVASVNERVVKGEI